MVNHDDIRQIAMALPGVEEIAEGFGFAVLNNGKLKGFCHLWRERVHPKKAKVPNPDVLVVVVRNLSEKEIILGSDTTKFFTEPHYDGYASILVRIAAVEPEEMQDLLIEAWRCKAPAELVAQLDKYVAGHEGVSITQPSA